MVLQSEGFTIDNYNFPPFTIEKGEYLTLLFSDPINFRVEKKLYEVLSGLTYNENVQISEKVTPVIEPILKHKFNFFSGKKAANYLKGNTEYSNEVIDSILQNLKIDPSSNIYSLGGSERKLLSLEVAYSKSKNIVISTSGLDYSGIERIKKRIIKELKEGCLIEINYLNSKGRDYLLNDPSLVSKSVMVTLL